MESQLISLSRELAGIAERISASIVSVEGHRRSFSSGVHWRKNLIVTAEHTVRHDEDATVVLPEGKRSQAKIVGRDPGTDIALLQGSDLDLPIIGNDVSKDIRPGEITLIAGRSPNSGPNISMGIISAVSGPWRTWRGGSLDKYIRLDANVFPGSSGGAVVNYEGSVIGIATSALSRIAGLAIPRTTVDNVVDALVKHGTVPRGYIGLTLQQVPLPESLRKTLSLRGTRGLMVLTVEPSGPAEKGGILIGDILFEISDVSVASVEDLQSMLTQQTIGKSMKVKVIRAGMKKDLDVAIGERPREKAS